MASYRQCRPYHEDGSTRKRQNCKGGKGMHAGMRQRVHFLHHKRGLRKVSAGEAQDGQWRGYSLRHDLPWLRKLLRSSQDLPFQVPRNPPRKSEQATHWAVCSRVRRAQRRRVREPTACTERRFRNGRRLDCLWLSRPQWKRNRVLVAPSSGNRSAKDGRRGSHRPGKTWEKLLDHQKTSDLRTSYLPRIHEEMGLRTCLLKSDCSNCRSICCGVIMRENRIPVVSTRCHLDVLSQDSVRIGWTEKGTRGRFGYLLSSYTLDYYWSRFYLLLTRADRHSLCDWESNTLKIALPMLQPLEYSL